MAETKVNVVEEAEARIAKDLFDYKVNRIESLLRNKVNQENAIKQAKKNIETIDEGIANVEKMKELPFNPSYISIDPGQFANLTFSTTCIAGSGVTCRSF